MSAPLLRGVVPARFRSAMPVPRSTPAGRRRRAALRRTLVVLIGLVPGLLAGPLAGPAAAAEPPGPPDPRPPAVVALGDSAASGEGAGNYEPGTRGEDGNWCHRSPAAYVHHTGLAAGVNFACSGAVAADVAGQARLLVPLARERRMLAVTLQVGANDEPALTDLAVECVRAFVDPRLRPCRETAGAGWPARLEAFRPRVEEAVRQVQAALAAAGAADVPVVVLSYAGTTTGAAPAWQGVKGCPYSRPDAEWVRTAVFPQLAAALGEVARRAGANFLDLRRATEGREACSGTLGSEWQRRLTVDPSVLTRTPLAESHRRLVQESFHPNAAAHAAIGACLGEFLRSLPAPQRPAGAGSGGDGAPVAPERAACVPGPGDTLRLVPTGGTQP